MKTIFHFHENKTHLPKKDFSLSLVLKVRGFGKSKMAYLDYQSQHQSLRSLLNLFARKDCFNLSEFSQRVNVAERTTDSLLSYFSTILNSQFYCMVSKQQALSLLITLKA